MFPYYLDLDLNRHLFETFQLYNSYIIRLITSIIASTTSLRRSFAITLLESALDATNSFFTYFKSIIRMTVASSSSPHVEKPS